MNFRRLWVLAVFLPLALAFLPSCANPGDDDSGPSQGDDDASPVDDDGGDDDDDNDNDSPSDDDDNDNDDDDDSADDDYTGPDDPLEPSADFLARQAEFLAYCDQYGAPPLGTTNGQVCRAFTGTGQFNEAAILLSLNTIASREDTADFDLNAVLRLLYLDREESILPADLKALMESTVLTFKYWLDESGPDDMCWWSENHQVLFHAAELLAGQLFPDQIFYNSLATGAEHAAHARELLDRWLAIRGRFGFAEWHSNVYLNETMAALLNLVDYSDDEAITVKAAMLLDELTFDLASNTYDGLYATAHGRTYESHLLDGLTDSTREAAWILLGLGDYLDPSNFTGAFLATSEKYWPPVILEDIAAAAAPALEHRQRDGLDIAAGPSYGVGYEDFADILVWWGMTGYAAPPIIAGTFEMVEYYNLWEGYLWSDLAFLRFLVGSPLLPSLAETYEPLARGVALESAGTYTYRTSAYQLSGVQDYKPALWSAQVQAWQATLDRTAFVFTSYPSIGWLTSLMDGPWIGGWLPRATFYRNVGVIQYWRPELPLIDHLLFADYTHAYFKRSAFDQTAARGHWVIGRKGEAYVALYSQNPPSWSAQNNYELIAPGRENIWIVELGDREHNGPFTQFVNAVAGATIEIGDRLTYESPSLGEVVVGREGPLTVAGETVDLGPFARWDNPYSFQEYGAQITRIHYDGQRLELDFQTPRRRYWSGAAE
ncbi:MAG: hypothetical protein GX444_15745 [Myxococcales bacterium]|nr:hypothetical protein [Myxococcales bacterium]